MSLEIFQLLKETWENFHPQFISTNILLCKYSKWSIFFSENKFLTTMKIDTAKQNVKINKFEKFKIFSVKDMAPCLRKLNHWPKKLALYKEKYILPRPLHPAKKVVESNAHAERLFKKTCIYTSLRETQNIVFYSNIVFNLN